MRNLINIILLILMVSCTSTKLIKHEKSISVRDIEVKNKSESIDLNVDLNKSGTVKIGKDVLIPEIVDSQLVKVEIPKEMNYKPIRRIIHLNDKTTAEIEISASIDSGQVDLKIDVPKVTYQESTIVEKIETDTTPNYTKWIIIISILALAGFILLILKLKG